MSWRSVLFLREMFFPTQTQVKRKHPGIKRWGIARDTDVTLQIHP